MKNLQGDIRMTLIALAMSGFAFTGIETGAQNHIGLAYNYSMLLGDAGDYIEKGSYRGGSFEFAHHLTNRTAVGLKVSLSTFYESLEKDTYTDENVTVYGKQFRYLNSSPVLLNFRYNFTDQGSTVIPYVKLGAGAYYIQKRTDIGFYTFVNDYQWNFGLQPEAGVLVPLGRTIGITASASFNQSFGNRSIGNQQYLAVGLGVTLINLGQR